MKPSSDISVTFLPPTRHRFEMGYGWVLTAMGDKGRRILFHLCWECIVKEGEGERGGENRSGCLEGARSSGVGLFFVATSTLCRHALREDLVCMHEKE